MPNVTDMQPFPAGFRTEDIPTNGAIMHVRIGGQGPAAVLLHGYGETGDMWVSLAAELARDHTVIVPDLRGMGLSSRPGGGYDKKNQGHDIAGVLGTLRIEEVDLICHDIGNMVGYAFAAQYPNRVARFVPEWADDPRKSRITLRQLGAHTSGLDDAEHIGIPHYWRIELEPPLVSTYCIGHGDSYQMIGPDRCLSVTEPFELNIAVADLLPPWAGRGGGPTVPEQGS